MRARPPLVSVVTPTWQRHDLLLDRCIPSVLTQAYSEIEHVIVSDGPDDGLWALINCLPSLQTGEVVYDQMERHDPAIAFGNRARLRALELVQGEFIAYLDDDNSWRSNHVELLVNALQDSDADFAYSSMLRHPNNDVIGTSPPAYSCLDTSILMHRRELLGRATWIPSQRADPDWDIVSRWLSAGATWTHVPVITCDYFFAR